MYKIYSRVFFSSVQIPLSKSFPVSAPSPHPAVTGQGDEMGPVKYCGNGKSFNS